MAVELGRLGGQKTKERYGKDYYKNMAQLREQSKSQRKRVLELMKVEDLENPITLKSIQDKLEQIDREN